MTPASSSVVVLDFGGQYTQLIARRVRDARVFSVVLPPNAPPEEIRRWNPRGVILSGGPQSVYEAGAPGPAPGLLERGVPILGLCYGMQWLAHAQGGEVLGGEGREYGRASARVSADSALFRGLEEAQTVWMNHGDSVTKPPPSFRVIASTDGTAIAGFEDPARAIYALQFHPEVRHTEHGTEILQNFIFRVCGARPDWNMASFRQERWRRSAALLPAGP